MSISPPLLSCFNKIVLLAVPRDLLSEIRPRSTGVSSNSGLISSFE
jgi:hypothetical protein